MYVETRPEKLAVCPAKFAPADGRELSLFKTGSSWSLYPILYPLNRLFFCRDRLRLI